MVLLNSSKAMASLVEIIWRPVLCLDLSRSTARVLFSNHFLREQEEIFVFLVVFLVPVWSLYKNFSTLSSALSRKILLNSENFAPLKKKEKRENVCYIEVICSCVHQKIICENQSKCENNMTYYIKENNLVVVSIF